MTEIDEIRKPARLAHCKPGASLFSAPKLADVLGCKLRKPDASHGTLRGASFASFASPLRGRLAGLAEKAAPASRAKALGVAVAGNDRADLCGPTRLTTLYAWPARPGEARQVSSAPTFPMQKAAR